MAVRCRIISGKSFCVNYLLSSRSNHFLDSQKFYHQRNDEHTHTCNAKKYLDKAIIVPFAEKFEQLLQPPVNFSSCLITETSQKSQTQGLISSRFSSHILMNQDNSVVSLSQIEKSPVLPSDIVKTETSKKSNSPAGSPSTSDKPSNRPSEEQVKCVFTYLSETLPKLMVKPVDYTMFDKDVIIEDNLKGVPRQLVGVVNVIKMVGMTKLWAHLKYAYVKFYVLKITSHPEEGCVKVRWRIAGVSTFKAYFQFWRVKEMMRKEEDVWHDGFSIFYVNSAGLISKVTLDKMMPDQENKLAKSDKIPLATGLAMVGIAPESLNSLVLFKWFSAAKNINRSANFSSCSIHHSCTSNTSVSSDCV